MATTRKATVNKPAAKQAKPKAATGPKLDYIDERLRPLAVLVKTLTPDPDNARKHPDENIDAIIKSLRQFGQRRPLVVQKNGMIVRAGNGVLTAAKELNWSHVAAIIIDEDDATAKAYGIADNRTGDLSEFDERELAAILEELEAENEALIESVGFNAAKINQLKLRFGKPNEGDGEQKKGKKKTGEGTKHLSLTYAATDYDRLRVALDYLANYYETENQEQLILTIVENAAEEAQQAEAGNILEDAPTKKAKRGGGMIIGEDQDDEDDDFEAPSFMTGATDDEDE